MVLRVAVQIPLCDREVLESWMRSSSVRAGLAKRARIVLLSADGVPIKDIVERVGVSKPTVIGWRKRYAAEGIGGLEDRPKPGRPAVIDEVRVVLTTLEPPPERLGVVHWSTRLLADQLEISHVWVGKIWHRWGLQPWRVKTLKFSTNPALDAKVRDVVGLYLNPPENAIVLSMDERSQAQTLDRNGPMLPMRLGISERETCHHVRDGTITLFAALERATGKFTDACYPHYRQQEFLQFLKQAAKAHPRDELHIVLDNNCGAQKHPTVRAWLKRNSRITLHFTPTSVSWLNMVEIFFEIIARHAISRGNLASVRVPIASIHRFVDEWIEPGHPFIWTKPSTTSSTTAAQVKRHHLREARRRNINLQCCVKERT